MSAPASKEQQLRSVLAALPHAPPFRFVDELLELEPGVQGRGILRITGDEDFLRGHFPGKPLVPGVIIAEALAQLCGLVGLSQSSLAAMLVHADVRWKRPVTPPADIVLQARAVRVLGPLHQFEAHASVGDVVVARGSLSLAASQPAANSGPSSPL